MKFLHLSFRNLLRHKLRTLLTVGAIAVALFCFALLQTFLTGLLSPAQAPATARRIWVRSRVSLAQPLPTGIEQKIAATDGVETIGKVAWFGGFWKEPNNFFANFAVDADKLDKIWTEFDFPAPALAEYRALKNGAIIGPALTRAPFNWKVGDVITLTHTIYPADVELKIVGVYEPKAGSPPNTLFFRWDYLAKSYETGEERTGTYCVIAASAGAVGPLQRAIDEKFRNSPYETKSESEREFQLGFISMLGNIALMINAITLAVVIAMLLVAATTVAMSTRERTTEIAVLKTLGFTPGRVIFLIVCESVTTAMVGGLIALIVAPPVGLFVSKMSQGFIPGMHLAGTVAAATLGLALLMGVIAAGFPAWNAARLKIVDGLRILN